MIEPKVGQVWIDMDRRMSGRKRTITRIAYNDDHSPRFVYYKSANGAEIRISVERLRHPFFRLDEDAPAPRGPAAS